MSPSGEAESLTVYSPLASTRGSRNRKRSPRRSPSDNAQADSAFDGTGSRPSLPGLAAVQSMGRSGRGTRQDTQEAVCAPNLWGASASNFGGPGAPPANASVVCGGRPACSQACQNVAATGMAPNTSGYRELESGVRCARQRERQLMPRAASHFSPNCSDSAVETGRCSRRHRSARPLIRSALG
jgi:hypothetical protein